MPPPFNMSSKDRAFFGNARTLQGLIHETEDLNAIREKLGLFIDSIVSFEPSLTDALIHNAKLSGWPEISRVIKAIHLVTDSQFSPGFDFAITLEKLDGTLDDFGVSVRIPVEPDAPGVIQGGCMRVGFPTQGRKTQEVDSIRLDFSRAPVIVEFTRNFSNHVGELANVLEGLSRQSKRSTETKNDEA